jgi:beta-glucosidase
VSDGTPGFDLTVTDVEGNVIDARTVSAINFEYCGPPGYTTPNCSSTSWPLGTLNNGMTHGWKATLTGRLKVATAGTYSFSIGGSGETQVSIDGELVAEVQSATTDSQKFLVSLDASQAGHLVEVTMDTLDYSWPMQFGLFSVYPTAYLSWYPGGDPMAEAEAVAAAADVALVFVSTAESEGEDHAAVLPGDQDEFVERVAAVAKKTVVVLGTGSALVLPWADRVDAIMENWYGGQQAGTAVANLLYGDVNPSGKSVATFAVSEAQLYARQTSQYPGVPLPYPDGEHLKVTYDEGILVGYRWFDQNQLDPLFPFGHGLSYTTFEYGKLGVTPEKGDGSSVTVKATIGNTGAVAGKEVAQLYVGFPQSAGEPPHQLKGFKKVALEPGQQTEVTFTLDPRSFSYWDEATGWTIAKGTYQILVGSSSRDIQLVGTYTVN